MSPIADDTGNILKPTRPRRPAAPPTSPSSGSSSGSFMGGATSAMVAAGRAASRRSPARTPATGGGAAPAVVPTPSPPPPAFAPGSAAKASELYAHMAWALAEPELGPILTKAAEEGWDENRLRGAIFTTQWFRTHGTAKVASQLKEQADAYLVPMDDQSRRDWAMKVITGEVQGAEFADYVKEQAKSLFPSLAAAIDRGVTVTAYAAPYRALAAQALEVAPESINLADPRWRRALDGSRDDKGQPAAMSLSEWERTIKTDGTYGWDRTKQARQQAAQFASSLMEKFGRVG